jgi:hypothetical protein
MTTPAATPTPTHTPSNLQTPTHHLQHASTSPPTLPPAQNRSPSYPHHRPVPSTRTSQTKTPRHSQPPRQAAPQATWDVSTRRDRSLRFRFPTGGDPARGPGRGGRSRSAAVLVWRVAGPSENDPWGGWVRVFLVVGWLGWRPGRGDGTEGCGGRVRC